MPITIIIVAAIALVALLVAIVLLVAIITLVLLGIARIGLPASLVAIRINGGLVMVITILITVLSVSAVLCHGSCHHSGKK
jgi:hypothetical protein